MSARGDAQAVGIDAGELRTLVREVLRDELARLHATRSAPAAAAPASTPRVETVAVRDDGELMAFVHRLLDISADGRRRRAIENGELAFRLATPGAAPQPCPAPAATHTAFAHGLVAEPQVEALEESVTRIEVGRSVRFTPLALDRLRQRGITVKRAKS